jgi:hypothetical protein
VRLLPLAGLIAALGLAVVGCGATSAGSAPANQAAQGGQSPQRNPQDFARFRQCLQDHGLARPSGPPPAGGAGQRPTLTAKQREAIQACRQYMPSRPQGGSGASVQGGGNSQTNFSGVSRRA